MSFPELPKTQRDIEALVTDAWQFGLGQLTFAAKLRLNLYWQDRPRLIVVPLAQDELDLEIGAMTVAALVQACLQHVEGGAMSLTEGAFNEPLVVVDAEGRRGIVFEWCQVSSRAPKKAKRNELCPCGSGKKHKRCCATN